MGATRRHTKHPGISPETGAGPPFGPARDRSEVALGNLQPRALVVPRHGTHPPAGGRPDELGEDHPTHVDRGATLSAPLPVALRRWATLPNSSVRCAISNSSNAVSSPLSTSRWRGPMNSSTVLISGTSPLFLISRPPSTKQAVYRRVVGPPAGWERDRRQERGEHRRHLGQVVGRVQGDPLG